MTVAQEGPIVRTWVVLFVAVSVVAGGIAAGLAMSALADALVLKGLPDPGPMTTIALPFVRAVGLVAGTIAVGCNVGAAFLVAPQDSGVLGADGYRFVRMGAWMSAVWALCATALVPLTLSDVSGKPLASFLDPFTVWNLAGLIDAAAGWRWTAGLAAIASCIGFSILRWSWTPVLLGASLATMIPLGLTGHSSSGGAHDMAISSLLVHLIATTIWAGGLLALMALALRRGGSAEVAVRRFSVLASLCAAGIIVTGVINAWVRVDPSDWLTSDYGRLVVVKTAAFVLLVALGWLHRRVSLPALAAASTNVRPFLRVGFVEAGVFAATMGIAVGLGRTPPPLPDEPVLEPSAAEVAIGYDLVSPATPLRLVSDWRVDVIFCLIAAGALAAYLFYAWRLRRESRQWSVRRTMAWLAGWAVAVVATSSGIGRYMPAVFSIHVVANLLLSIVAPILLVLGSPGALMLQATAVAQDVSGTAWIRRVGGNSFALFLRRPEVGASIFLTTFVGIYLSGLYDILISTHAGHLAFNLAMFVVGCYFWQCVLTGSPPDQRCRLLSAAGAMVGMIAFGVALALWPTVLGENHYLSLRLPWTQDLGGDQQTAGEIVAVVCALILMSLLIRIATNAYRQPSGGHAAAAIDITAGTP